MRGNGTPTADILGAVAIASLLLQPTDALIQSGLETVQAISDYGKLLLPVMSAGAGGVRRDHHGVCPLYGDGHV